MLTVERQFYLLNNGLSSRTPTAKTLGIGRVSLYRPLEQAAAGELA
jgi:hypothetical protein